MEDIIFVENVDLSEYFLATYEVESAVSLKKAALEIAIGQSVGNPNHRSVWENSDLFEKYCCKILANPHELEQEKFGIVKIAFPIININWSSDGISHMLCTVLGGQVDIKDIVKCRLVNLELPPHVIKELQVSQAYGINGMREFTNVPTQRPFVGAIIKPKIGVTPDILLEIVKELVEGGVNFIKEDEILSDFSVCPIHVRVPLVMDYLKDKNVIYCISINAEPHELFDRVKQVVELGANGIHVNFWCGLGIYRSIRLVPGGDKLFIHYQQSGSRILTDKRAPYSIDFNVLCMLAGICGVDSMHIGNLFGYSNETTEEILQYVDTLKKYNVIPTLSCGLHAGNVNAITSKIGTDYIANSGGAIHSHPEGTRAGVRALVQAVEGDFEGEEYKMAIEKFGLFTG